MKIFIITILFITLIGYLLYLLKGKIILLINGLLTFLTQNVNKITKLLEKFTNNRAMYNRYLASGGELNDDLKRISENAAELVREVGVTVEEAAKSLSSVLKDLDEDRDILNKIFKLRNEYKQKHGVYPNEIIIDAEDLRDLNCSYGTRVIHSENLYKVYVMDILITQDFYKNQLKVTFRQKQTLPDRIF